MKTQSEIENEVMQNVLMSLQIRMKDDLKKSDPQTSNRSTRKEPRK